ncbi:hydrogenase maturation protease [Myxococcota bacterium]|nr:hydrogenase maturation protease [Myxococcota bacterium]MBU1382474.1 hydrogenase maturation protease [Myxococcota bacterium]MBU1499226.1 hydrogenase maturation protease [Myxococcota bacterium]
MKYIIGTGNWTMTDDSIGLRLIEFMDQKYPERDFELVDLSISAFNLMTYLTEETEKIVIVDCIRNEGNHGDVTFFNYEDVESIKDLSNFTTHEDDVVKIISMAQTMNYHIPPIVFMGITPEKIEYGMTLSPSLEVRLDEYATSALNELSKD